MDEILNLIESVSEGFPSYFFSLISLMFISFWFLLTTISLFIVETESVKIMNKVFLYTIKCIYIGPLETASYVFIVTGSIICRLNKFNWAMGMFSRFTGKKCRL